MDVYESTLESTATSIDVASIDDLARLAERQSTMILHMTRNFLHYYLVQGSGVTYRYVISTRKKGIVKVEPSRDEIIDHTIDSDEHNVIYVEPVNEVLTSGTMYSDKNNDPKAETTGKMILRYSISANKNHSND